MRALKPLPSRRTASAFQRQEEIEPHEAVKVSELADDYILRCEIRGFSPKTVQLYRADLSAFIRFAAENSSERLSQIGHHHIEGFLRAAQERGCSAHTVHRLYRNLRAFFRDAARLYESFVPPTDKVRPPRLPVMPPKALTLEQIQQLLGQCKRLARQGGRKGFSARRDAFFIRFAFDTGFRLSEALSVRLEDIDDATGTILIRQGKGGQPRTVMVGPKTLLELRRHVRSLPEGAIHLFSGKGGRKPIQGDRLRKRLGEMGKLAGFVVSPHRFRHSCARSMIMDGAGIQTVQARLGHTTPTMTLHYSKMFATDTLEQGRKFAPGDRL